LAKPNGLRYPLVGGAWRKKPPDAKSAFWSRYPESAGKAPHLSGARGVGPRFWKCITFLIINKPISNHFAHAKRLFNKTKF
jgi:hypothetical protein